jgi:tetratricopeptide (TPR) repeat protein
VSAAIAAWPCLRARAADAPATLESGSTANHPWAAGVTAEQQQAAGALLVQGNLFLTDGRYAEAEEKYHQALEKWDHPGIHYNLALVLLPLNRPLEVHEHLEKALRYGAAPLDKDKYERARNYLALVEGQLAVLEVRCDLYGASVNLDGKPLFKAPGSYKGLVMPGPHTVTASKEGYPTTERSKILLPGTPTTINIRLFTEGELIQYRRRWPMWRPVAVTAAGAVLLATGVVLTIQSRNRFDSYDNQVNAKCSTNGGCVGDTELANLKDQGNTLQKLATVSYVAGGVVLAAGVALLTLDRSVPYRVDPEGQRRDVASRGPLLTPFLAPGMAGVVGRF